MSNKHDAQELERQADAILAAAEAEETPSEPAPPRVMTDEEAKKAGIIRLDDKQVAALPAASWLINNEKLRELLAKSKKKGKVESAELMEAVDDLNLEGEQMDQLYDSLEALNIDISAEEDLLPELPAEGPVVAQGRQALPQGLPVPGGEEVAVHPFVNEVGDAPHGGGDGGQAEPGPFGKGVGKGLGQAGQHVDVQGAVKAVHAPADPPGEGHVGLHPQLPGQGGQLLPLLAVPGDYKA